MGKCRRLSFKYYGPFEVLRRTGEQSYKLALPHNCMCVMYFVSESMFPIQVILDLEDNVLVNQEEFRMEPEQILKIQEKQLRNQAL